MRTARVERRNGAPSVGTVKAYLPCNYVVTGYDAGEIIIRGEDDHGWTLDGYVIPRLASGLIGCTEVLARPLHKIADDITAHWAWPYFGAVPYIDAMRHLATLDESFGDQAAVNIVIHFLVNAGTWRGPDARRIKQELRGLPS
jgi:hypothetical protein